MTLLALEPNLVTGEKSWFCQIGRFPEGPERSYYMAFSPVMWLPGCTCGILL